MGRHDKAKYAMSLDGKTAARSADARWISGEESRRHVHALRDGVDAVVVGSAPSWRMTRP